MCAKRRALGFSCGTMMTTMNMLWRANCFCSIVSKLFLSRYFCTQTRLHTRTYKHNSSALPWASAVAQWWPPWICCGERIAFVLLSASCFSQGIFARKHAYTRKYKHNSSALLRDKCLWIHCGLWLTFVLLSVFAHILSSTHTHSHSHKYIIAQTYSLGSFPICLWLNKSIKWCVFFYSSFFCWCESGPCKAPFAAASDGCFPGIASSRGVDLSGWCFAARH